MLAKLRALFCNPWFVWCLTALTVLLQFLLQTSVTVIMPQLRSAFNTEVLGVSIISASFFYTYILLQMPAGMLFDKFPARKIFTLGIMGVAFACLLFAFAPNITTAMFSRLIMGAFCAIAFPGVLYMAANLFPPQRFALLVGITEMCGMLGAALGEQGLAHAVAYVGWRHAILYCALFASLLSILLFMAIGSYTSKNATLNPIQLNDERQDGVYQRLCIVMKMPQAWLCGIYSGLMFAIITTFASLWCIPYLLKTYPINITEAATACSMLFLGAACGNPILGWLSDCIRRRKPVLLISANISLLLLISIFYLPHVSIIMMSILLFCLGFVCSGYALPFAIAREITLPKCRGAMMGFINMLGISIGGPVLQPIIGWLLTKYYNAATTENALHFNVQLYQHVIGNSMIICMLLALIVAISIRETHCKETY